MAKKKRDFQQAFARLENIVSDMENNETSLEKMMDLYKEGVDLSVWLNQQLQAAEQEVTVLQQSSDGLFHQKPFEVVKEDDDEIF